MCGDETTDIAPVRRDAGLRYCPIRFPTYCCSAETDRNKCYTNVLRTVPTLSMVTSRYFWKTPPLVLVNIVTAFHGLLLKWRRGTGGTLSQLGTFLY
jgi:hypothetical protein